MKRILSGLLAFCLSHLLTNAASAAIVVQDMFDGYTSGSALDSNGSASGGWGTAWLDLSGLPNSYVINSTPLTYLNYAGNGANDATARGVTATAGSSGFGGASARVVGGTPFPGEVGGLTTTYTSYLVNFNSLASLNLMSFGLWANGLGSSIMFGSNGSNWVLNNSTVNTLDPLAPVPVTTGVTHLVVIRSDYVPNVSNTHSVFLNPVLLSPEPLVPFMSLTQGGISHPTLGHYSEGNGGTVALYDGVVFATAWSDLSIIPEPGTYALFGCAVVGFGMFGYRRRKILAV